MPIHRYLSILGIIAFAAAVFVFGEMREEPFADEYGAVPAKVVAAFHAIRSGDVSVGALCELATLVTAIFLHAGAEHIVYNMVFLWIFGSLTADYLGQWRALAAFFLCGIMGNVVQVALDPASPIPIVGASGAISGFAGLFFGLALRWQLPWVEVWPVAYPIPPQQLAVVAAIGFAGDMLMITNQDSHIAYGAHLGGFLTGLAIAAIVTTLYPTQYAYDRSRRKD
jgi:membrane associated rhomboid family serine protease